VRTLRLLLAAVALILAVAASAQDGPVPGASGDLDLGRWEAVAIGAETALEGPAMPESRILLLREELAAWRAAFLTAQTSNSTRIATVKEQIAALGPPPAEGAEEPAEIAGRRESLANLLGRLQAPGLAAEEAYRRADGLIREIDRILRERQADELLQLWPSALNPANWPEGAVGLSDTALRIWDEAQEGWADPRARGTLVDNLPLILVLVILWAALTLYARGWIEGFAERLQAGGSETRRRVLALLASTGQVIVPTLGVVALAEALKATGMLGEVTGRIVAALPGLGLVLFLAIWLGARSFSRQHDGDAVLPLPPEQRTEGRFLAGMMGLVLAAEGLRSAAMDAQAYSNGVTSIASFPILIAGALLLWRIGRVIGRGREDGQSFVRTLLGLMARAVGVVALIGPVLSAFGYVAAARGMIFPAIVTLGLVAGIFILQRLIADLWALVSPGDNDAVEREGLVPVLAGFALVLAAVPVFALVWGARASDLTELWTRFREGFQVGATRVSPTDFLLFAVIFVLGYLLTRLFQGALRTTILPKTRMDLGGQTALVAGTGYLGIFLAALIAINATGIDLSGLAIVAGALSVGIGFGLQTIVSNFVSGIILLIERPVSEGDWIEVGTVSGTVKAISVRATRIQTFDRSTVIVPNADLVTQRVTNWTRFSLAGRLIVPVAVVHGSDSRQVERILREIAEAQPMCILNPPPIIAAMGFTLDGITFEIRMILRDVNFQLQVRSDVNHAILQRFAAEGILMAQTGGPAAAQAALDARGVPAAPAPIPAEDEATSG
jgi:potassium-dependent mechanosensitive channel